MDIETDFALALDIGHDVINTHIVKISVKVGNLWFYFLVCGLKLLAIKGSEQDTNCVLALHIGQAITIKHALYFAFVDVPHTTGCVMFLTFTVLCSGNMEDLT